MRDKEEKQASQDIYSRFSNSTWLWEAPTTEAIVWDVINPAAAQLSQPPN